MGTSFTYQNFLTDADDVGRYLKIFLELFLFGQHKYEDGRLEMSYKPIFWKIS